MLRRCSHCSNNGHNSRTCPTRGGGGGGGGGGGVRLFGVCLTEGVGTMKKSASVGCLSSLALAGSSSGASPSGDRLGHLHNAGGARVSGYASDDPVHASSSSIRNQRKKGIPWTKEEHQKFLLGLEKLGKGDWRGISKSYVVTRTPTQVASHAQKYFIRQSNASRRKRRTSLFDMVPEMPNAQVPVPEEHTAPQAPFEPKNTIGVQSLQHGSQQEPEAVNPLKTNHATEASKSIMFANTPTAMVPTYYRAFIPVPLAFWPSTLSTAVPDEHMQGASQVVKPTPVVPKEPVKVDEVLGMSKLSIEEGSGTRIEPSDLSLKLLSSSESRQSAFHINPSSGVPDLNYPIHAV